MPFNFVAAVFDCLLILAAVVYWCEALWLLVTTAQPTGHWCEALWLLVTTAQPTGHWREAQRRLLKPDPLRLHLCFDTELGRFKRVGLRHCVFRPIEAIENQLPKIRVADLAGHVNVVFPLLIG